MTPFQWFILGALVAFPSGAFFAMGLRALLDRVL